MLDQNNKHGINTIIGDVSTHIKEKYFNINMMRNTCTRANNSKYFIHVQCILIITVLIIVAVSYYTKRRHETTLTKKGGENISLGTGLFNWPSRATESKE